MGVGANGLPRICIIGSPAFCVSMFYERVLLSGGKRVLVRCRNYVARSARSFWIGAAPDAILVPHSAPHSR